VTFFECATGVQPFTDGAANQFEILRRIENNTMPQLRLACAASNSLTDLISSLTQRRRDHRPSNVAKALFWMQDILGAQTRA
jgi:eukaryotic-like serine/threonine-protein kinase